MPVANVHVVNPTGPLPLENAHGTMFILQFSSRSGAVGASCARPTFCNFAKPSCVEALSCTVVAIQPPLMHVIMLGYSASFWVMLGYAGSFIMLGRRWEACSEMGTLFHKLQDAYQAAKATSDCSPLSEALVATCKQAAEAHHAFAKRGMLGQAGLDILLGFLETDAIPVCCCCCCCCCNLILCRACLHGDLLRQFVLRHSSCVPAVQASR